MDPYGRVYTHVEVCKTYTGLYLGLSEAKEHHWAMPQEPRTVLRAGGGVHGRRVARSKLGLGLGCRAAPWCTHVRDIRV